MSERQEETIRRIAMRLLALSQTGLEYVRDPFDRERYVETGELGAELIELVTTAPIEALHRHVAPDVGYATPKVDVRGALFDEDGRVLLVQEASDGLWTLPGGWADVGDTPAESVEREMREESGFGVRAVRLVAAFDRDRQGHVPPMPVSIYKLFFLCEHDGSEPTAPQESETLAVGWFDLDEGRYTCEQPDVASTLLYCGERYRAHGRREDGASAALVAIELVDKGF